VADGTILVGGTSQAGLRRARGLIDEGRPVGRLEPHRIVQYLPAATGADADERMARDRSHWNDTSEEETVAVGDAAAVAAVVKRFAEAGADTVVLQPTLDEPDPEAFVRFVGAEVAPLVG
jgi:alkanesulfonate monooxygenase SsuD/methylene tetrahydromethanopterin reductase-like flavin-dependent oxidoreductase (luciferase family)